MIIPGLFRLTVVVVDAVTCPGNQKGMRGWPFFRSSYVGLRLMTTEGILAVIKSMRTELTS